MARKKKKHNADNSVNAASNKIKNTALCPVHKTKMTSLVNAYTDDVKADVLNVDTFACMESNCTKQAVIYGGDVDLFVKIREHYGIK